MLWSFGSMGYGTVVLKISLELQGYEPNKQLLAKLESAKAKLDNIIQMKPKLVLENSKVLLLNPNFLNFSYILI